MGWNKFRCGYGCGREFDKIDETLAHEKNCPKRKRETEQPKAKKSLKSRGGHSARSARAAKKKKEK